MKQNIIIYLQEERTVSKDLLILLQELLIDNFPSEDYSSALGKLLDGRKIIYVGQMYLEGDDANYIIISYPKYLKLSFDLHQYFVEGQDIDAEHQNTIDLVKKEMHLVCQVIELANKSIYDKYGDFSPLNRNSSSKKVTQFSVAEFLLKDYVQNGKYLFTELVEKINGNGPINWNHTMNSCTPLIQNGKAIYIDFVNMGEEESQTYIYLAYINAVTEAFKLYGEILGYSFIDIPSIEGEDFNEIRTVNFLKGYLSQMYDGRGYFIVKALCAWYESKSEFRVNYCGSNCFDRVWEVVLQSVFNHDETLWQGKMKLPRWSMTKDGVSYESFVRRDAITLLPDITNINKNNFFILDAKYYCPSFVDNHYCDGVPATTDVTKQVNYYQQLKDYYGNQYHYLNAFLLPKYDVENSDWLLEYSGYIKLETSGDLLFRINEGDFSVPQEEILEEDVKVFNVNTSKLYEVFLDGNFIDDETINRLPTLNLAE